MRLRRALFFILPCLAVSVALHAGLSESAKAIMDPAQELLRNAAVDPTPGSLALMVLVLGLIPFSIIVPMTACSVFAGAILPGSLGPPVILGGMLLNTVISWTIARTVFGRRLEAWIEKRGGPLGQLRANAKKAPFKWSFFSRFIPSPFALAPMVLASAGVSLSRVFWATALVMTPWSFAYSWAGRESREGSLGSLAAAGLGVVAISALTVWAYRRFVQPAQAQAGRNSHPGKAVSKTKMKPKPRSKLQAKLQAKPSARSRKAQA